MNIHGIYNTIYNGRHCPFLTTLLKLIIGNEYMAVGYINPGTDADITYKHINPR